MNIHSFFICPTGPDFTTMDAVKTTGYLVSCCPFVHLVHNGPRGLFVPPGNHIGILHTGYAAQGGMPPLPPLPYGLRNDREQVFDQDK